jgi:hypothetical protein
MEDYPTTLNLLSDSTGGLETTVGQEHQAIKTRSYNK